MPKTTVLLIGCGRMGHGIARMMLQDQRRQNLTLTLWIYDPYQPAETRCQEDAEHLQLDTVHSLREYITPEDQIILQKLIPQIESSKNALQQTYKILLHAIHEIRPHLFVNAATFYSQQLYIPLARAVHCDYIDLGQKLPARTQLKQLDEELGNASKGVRLVQESGLAPGLANILAVNQYKNVLDETEDSVVFSVQMRVGGLPQHTGKGGPLHFGPSFSPEGLVYEYEGAAVGLQQGQLITTSTFADSEYWEESNTTPIPFGVRPFEIKSEQIRQILESRLHPKHHGSHEEHLLLQGLQARPTADGTSRMCFDPKFQQTVHNLEYKTLRFSPHYQTWTSLKTNGELDSTLRVWEKNINDPKVSGYPDMVLLRVWAQATPKSTPQKIELVVLHDDVPVGSIEGYTAMQHLTGWPTVLIAYELLHNPPGKSYSSQTGLLQSSKVKTGFGRSLQSVLKSGGVIAPYELIDGEKLMKQLTIPGRIPLYQVIC
jgi:hypothetical protein